MLTPEQNHELHTLHIRRMDILSQRSWLIVLLITLLFVGHRVEMWLFYNDAEKVELSLEAEQAQHDQLTDHVLGLETQIVTLQQRMDAAEHDVNHLSEKGEKE